MKFQLINFKNLNQPTAEMVLEWRNSERIRKYMLDDSIIALENHLNFIENLKTDQTKLYFLLELNEQPIGVIYLINVGEEKITWGCYLGIENPLPGMFLVLINLAGKLAFSYSTTKYLISQVASFNKSVIETNKYLQINQVNSEVLQTKTGKQAEFLNYQTNQQEFIEIETKILKLISKPLKQALTELLTELKL